MADDTPDSAFAGVTESNVGGTLRRLLFADDILPGDEVSYQTCKAIWLYHPLGNKMAESPVRLAQSQERIIEVDSEPKEELVKAFKDEWKKLQATRHILNLMTQARVYGMCSIGLGDNDDQSKLAEPVDLKTLWKKDIFFNILDPINTPGLIIDQNPNSPTFQKHGDLHVNGQVWHRSRTRTILNEEPVYIAWTSASFAYAGRSVYQRALYPLKSFIQSMVTDDMVTRKAGLLIAHMEQPGSVVNRISQAMFGVKRALLKEARTNQVLTIGLDEQVESLNMQNIDASHKTARENIIVNAATANDMPSKLLTNEAFVEGFGEGTQDAYAVAQYINRVRIEMQPAYDFFDTICMYRAWNEEFYEGLKNKFPDAFDKESTYESAFYKWKNGYNATWLSLIEEPESDKVNVDDVKLKAAIAIIQVLSPLLDPFNTARLIQWLNDVVAAREELFGSAPDFDQELLEAWLEDQATQMMAGGMGGGEEQLAQEEDSATPAKPFSSRDSGSGRIIDLLEQVSGKRQ